MGIARGRTGAGIVAVAASLATVFPVCAQRQSPSQAAFAVQRERQVRLMAQGDWPAARRALQALVLEHGEQPYLMAERDALLDDWVRCAFFCEWRPPRPHELVAGRLVRKAAGVVALRYGEGLDGDFDVDLEHGARYHHAWFEGTRSLSLEGVRLPDDGVQLVVASDDGVSLFVDPGVAPFEQGGALRHRPPRIQIVSARGEATLAEGERSPLERGKPFAVEIELSSAGIAVRCGEDLILETEFEPAWSVGGLSLEGSRLGYVAEGPVAVTLVGAVRAEWLAGLADRARQRAHDDFVRRYDLAGDVPAWLLDGPVPPTPAGEVAPARVPAWQRTFEWQGDGYRVRSDVDRGLCLAVGLHLSGARREFERVFGPVPAAGARAPFEVFVFSGRDGYEAHLRRVTGKIPALTSGVFVPELDQLLLHDPGDRAELASVVRHEGLHQYLHRRFRVLPAWFNEGAAVYVERGVDGAVRQDLVATLVGGRDRLVPMDRFLFLDYDGFYTRPDVHYAQAWATVHLLRHGPQRYRGLFAELLRACEGDASEAVTSLRVMGHERFERLDEALREHLESLRER